MNVAYFFPLSIFIYLSDQSLSYNRRDYFLQPQVHSVKTSILIDLHLQLAVTEFNSLKHIYINTFVVVHADRSHFIPAGNEQVLFFEHEPRLIKRGNAFSPKLIHLYRTGHLDRFQSHCWIFWVNFFPYSFFFPFDFFTMNFMFITSLLIVGLFFMASFGISCPLLVLPWVTCLVWAGIQNGCKLWIVILSQLIQQFCVVYLTRFWFLH